MENANPILLVYLDAYHLGDPLFLRGLARDVKEHAGPMILLHGSGEEIERAFEAKGWFTAEEREQPAANALVERSIRDLNRRVVHELNEAGISSVGVLGSDRGLLKSAVDGSLSAGKMDWLTDLAVRGAMPVIGLLSTSASGKVAESGVGEAMPVLADTIEGVEVIAVWFTKSNKPCLSQGDSPIRLIDIRDVADNTEVAEGDALARVAQSVRAVVASPRALRKGGVPEGTEISF